MAADYEAGCALSSIAAFSAHDFAVTRGIAPMIVCR